MSVIRILCDKDVMNYKEKFIQYIMCTSDENDIYVESNLKEKAEKKYIELFSNLKDKRVFVHGAIEKDNLIGFSIGHKCAFRDDVLRLYIDALYVDERFRGLHIGSQLLRQLENHAEEEGLHTIFLHVETSNKTAIKFYHQKGYEIERVQMVKTEFITTDVDKENGIECEQGSMRFLQAKDIKDNEKELVKLFLMNTKAHILTSTFDEYWANEKIKELEKYVEDNKAIVYGFFDKEVLIGFVWIFPYKYKGEERYLLNAITVCPKVRGKKVADKLFQSIEEQMKMENKVLYTFVDKANERAYRFYKKHGMREEMYQYTKNLMR